MNGIDMDISFCELRTKDVVNACDGRKLGRVVDIVFCGETGVVRGIVAPVCKRGLFSKPQEVFIPWRCIKTLGTDVILVDIRTGDGRGIDQNGCCHPRFDDCAPSDCYPPPHSECSCGHDKGDCNRGHSDCGCADDGPDCDHRCDKCMLFDCAYRWKKRK